MNLEATRERSIDCCVWLFTYLLFYSFINMVVTSLLECLVHSCIFLFANRLILTKKKEEKRVVVVAAHRFWENVQPVT